MACRAGINCTRGSCEFAHPSPARRCSDEEQPLIQGFGSMSLASPSSGRGVIPRAGASFKASFGVRDDLMENLERALSDRRQKMAVMLVDLDNVPKFYQRQSVQALAKAPFPVFVVESARTRQTALPSKDNFHFALKSNMRMGFSTWWRAQCKC